MINRLSARPGSSFTNSNSERPFDFAREQHLKFSADLDGQILELEQRHALQTCAPQIPQQRINTNASTAHDEREPCTFDDFGLVQGLEIDVSWM
jgi:hypothetical protein